ncbi:MAG: FeoB-associated Cys-rich membrane protein [Selenomonadaceae bacterium]|nr:FeoB-associated Cys-rich membrane protein [Selenomonadaceae bacterium]MDY2686371.1 FeoB-associated Cys-rich membrane protein [Selenomonadaceae bacterium]
MATILCVAVVAVALFFALRHVCRNAKHMHSDCYGCSGCNACTHGGSCHPSVPKK